MEERFINDLVRKYTAARNLAELANLGAGNGFCHNLSTLNRNKKQSAELTALADAFDAEMIARGDSRRAWRGTKGN